MIAQAALLIALANPAVEKCLGLSAGNDLTRRYAQWTALESAHRWRDAVKTGIPVTAAGVQCVTGAPWSSGLAQYMIVPLQWVVMLGIDAYRDRDLRTMRGLGVQYEPIATRYQAADRDDFELAAYKHVLLYLTDFRNGHCSFDLCQSKQYP